MDSQARASRRRALLATYLRPEWPRAVLLGLLLFAGIGLQLANPQIARTFIDRAQAGEPLERLIWTALLFIGVAILAQAPVYLRGVPPEPPLPPPRERFERLEVRGLAYTYPAGARGIVDVSFALERGSFTAITGRIGAGKTTLLHALLGLLPRGVKLSGGQVQRAAAARMFVRDAELLVFDDLSSALDAETEAELWRRLFARGRDATCLVVSHRPTALRQADQVLRMDAGRVVARGTLAELLTSSAEMRRLWQDEQGSLEAPVR